MTKYARETLYILGLLILPMLLYWDVTVGPNTMLPADNLYQWEPWATHSEAFGVEVPDNALISDLIIQNYNWKRYIRDTVRSGDIPLWNQNLFAGAPFLATGQNAAYYPFGLIFLAVPLVKAYGWFTVSQLWLAGIMLYILGRTYRLKPASAFAGGLIYQGCGFMLVSAAVFPMIISAAAWLPLLIACLEKIIRTTSDPNGAGKTLPWAALGALTLGVQILAGHIEITYYTLMVMAFYAAWRLVAIGGVRFALSDEHKSPISLLSSSITPLLKPSAWLLATVFTGIMVGGIQFIPFYEVGATNFREGSATLEQIQDWAFPERRILTLVLPNFFGNPTHHGYTDTFSGEQLPFTTNVYGNVNPHGPFSSNWGIKNYVEGGIYFGIPALVLVLLGLLKWISDIRFWIYDFRKRGDANSTDSSIVNRQSSIPIPFYLTLSLFSLAFIFGTPLYAILYYGFPGINQLHSPFRWVFPLSLCVSVIAAYGVDAISGDQYPMSKGRKSGLGHRSSVTTISILTATAGLLTLIGLYVSRAIYPSLEPQLTPIFLGIAQAPDAFADFRAFYSYLFPQVQHLGFVLIGTGLAVWLFDEGVRRWGERVQSDLSPSPTAEDAFIRPLISNQREWVSSSLHRLYHIGYDLLIAVLILDLFLIGSGFNASVDPALLHFKSEMVQWLENRPENDQWRITSFDNKGTKPFNANSAWLIGIQDIRGYDSIIAKQYTEYMQAIEPQEIGLLANRIEPLSNWESINSPLVDLLGVKYIVTEETLELPKLSLAWQGEGLNIYENLGVVPRAYLISESSTVAAQSDEEVLPLTQAFDPRFHTIVPSEMWESADDHFRAGQPSMITEVAADPLGLLVDYPSNRRAFVSTSVEQTSWLILNDSYFPGWRAYREGRSAAGEIVAETEMDVARVNGNFRGVLLPPGEWTVRFQYSPPTFWVGGLTSALGLIVIGFSFVVWGWRRYYRQEGELSNTASIAKNSVAPMTLNLFNRGIDFLFAIFYLRWLGPVDSGAYTTAITIAGIYEILSNFGLNAYLIREVSQDKSKTTNYLLNTTILRIGTGLIAAIPILLYILTAENNPDTRTAVVYLMVGMVLSGMASGLTGLFYAYEEAEIPASITTITTILKVGFGVMVLLIGFGFVGLAVVSIFVNAITLIILILIVRRRYELDHLSKLEIDFGLQRRMLIDSYPLMINHFLATVYWQVDILILRQIQGEATVGWYNTAYKYINAFNVIPSFFTFALFPVISRQVQSNLEDARRTFQMAIKLLTLVSLPLAATVTFLAPIMIGILGGGEFLPEGQIALQVVIWSIPFGWLNSVTNYVLISLGQERIQTRAFVIGVGFNFLTNLIAIPLLSYVGAGLTTIASEILLLALFNYYLVQKMPRVGWLQILWKIVLVTAGMLLVMALLTPLNLWLGVLVGLIVYPAGLWGIGVFGEAEQKILADILPETVSKRLRL
ncbi:MAG: oligosaccharide flippase family protein [Chloroflexota bacterium]